ncbi:SpoIIE family protein phosphatase [bacterium]|nr:SpoIIE family protein phosphatase [bacterium]
MIKNSITLKYILLTLLLVLPVMVAVGYFSYKTSVSIVVEQTIINSETIVSSAIDKIELITQPIEEISSDLAQTYSNNSEILKKQLEGGVRINSNIFGMAAAFEPYKYAVEREKFSPYAFRKDEKIAFTDLNKKSYDYLNQKWYAEPKKRKKALWSEPYFDEGGGNKLMATFSTPIFEDSLFIGVTTADITLEKINTIVSSISILESGHIFLLSKKGRFISHPNSNIVMKKSLTEYASELSNHRLKVIAQRIKQGTTGFLPYELDDKEHIVYFSPIESMGWYIGIVFPRNELFAPLHRLTKMTFIISFIGVLLLVLAVIVVTRRTTRRITALSKITEVIAAGNFSHHIEHDSSSDEIGKLSTSFNNMQVSLVKHIDNLQKVTAGKQKIESELQIAREIQMGILPTHFPSFPTPHNFDVFATINPAREVGGDFYDFFFVDENRFCFVIGDVSGKGVPAALFMAVSKTLIKATATAGKSLAETMTIVNNELILNNDSCMFVTVFIGILDVHTGEIEFSCAGHNPPVKLTENSSEMVAVHPSPPLGAFSDVLYTSHTTQLKYGESLFLYTDGVTEAFNTEKRQYSCERLQNQLKPQSANSSSAIIESVTQSVERFTKNALQSDDITMLNIRFLKKDPPTFGFPLNKGD